ncbi:hypothetical protein Peur_071678 [Populus x canadensis]
MSGRRRRRQTKIPETLKNIHAVSWWQKPLCNSCQSHRIFFQQLRHACHCYHPRFLTTTPLGSSLFLSTMYVIVNSCQSR